MLQVGTDRAELTNFGASVIIDVLINGGFVMVTVIAKMRRMNKTVVSISSTMVLWGCRCQQLTVLWILSKIDLPM